MQHLRPSPDCKLPLLPRLAGADQRAKGNDVGGHRSLPHLLEEPPCLRPVPALGAGSDHGAVGRRARPEPGAPHLREAALCRGPALLRRQGSEQGSVGGLVGLQRDRAHLGQEPGRTLALPGPCAGAERGGEAHDVGLRASPLHGLQGAQGLAPQLLPAVAADQGRVALHATAAPSCPPRGQCVFRQAQQQQGARPRGRAAGLTCPALRPPRACADPSPGRPNLRRLSLCHA
mmetsp:Transcript_1261/g.3911  ORF Transcript_1261/g.3911 Transcript_1261/m.3911 type:complete len:232 (+) Transcript_1261:1214-1909(+)